MGLCDCEMYVEGVANSNTVVGNIIGTWRSGGASVDSLGNIRRLVQVVNIEICYPQICFRARENGCRQGNAQSGVRTGTVCIFPNFRRAVP